MINTKFMKCIGRYNYYGVMESAHKHGNRYYMSIIDHRVCDTPLDDVYDEFGVYLVDRGYIDKWASCRGIVIK